MGSHLRWERIEHGKDDSSYMRFFFICFRPRQTQYLCVSIVSSVAESTVPQIVRPHPYPDSRYGRIEGNERRNAADP